MTAGRELAALLARVGWSQREAHRQLPSMPRRNIQAMCADEIRVDPVLVDYLQRLAGAIDGVAKPEFYDRRFGPRERDRC